MESTVIDHDTQILSMEARNRSNELTENHAETVEKPIKQYVYFAFRRSLRDAESYDCAASGIPRDDQRSAFFREMADRKREEAEILYSYYKADGYRIIKDLRKRSIIAHPHYLDSADPAQFASIEDTYSFAFKKERNNLDLYSKLANLDSNPDTKILFDYLSQMQISHIVFIEKKLSKVTTLS